MFQKYNNTNYNFMQEKKATTWCPFLETRTWYAASYHYEKIMIDYQEFSSTPRYICNAHKMAMILEASAPNCY